MKVVLFCGGQGMRLRDHGDAVPKPMVPIGNRPILWHLMKYYAHFGHTEFILCLGYKSEVIKEYFLNYNEWVSNDFVLTDGGRDIRLLSSDIDDWKITFADTGIQATIGERLKAVEPYLDDEEVFLANYADGLTDLSLPRIPGRVPRAAGGRQLHGRPLRRSPSTWRDVAETACARRSSRSATSDIWFNAGYFIFRREIFTTSSRRGARRRAVPATHRRAQAARRTGTRLLAGDGHVQGSPGPRERTSRATRHGRSGSSHPGAVEPGGRGLARMLVIGNPVAGYPRVLCSALTATTSRSAAAARCSSSSSRHRASRWTGSSSAPGERERGGTAQRRPLPRRRR